MKRLLITFTSAAFLFPTLTVAALISATATGPTASIIDSNASVLHPSVNATVGLGFPPQGRASAAQSGELEVYSSGDKVDEAFTLYSASAHWQQTVTNTSGSTASYQLDFSTGAGRIGFSSHTDPNTGTIFSSGSSGYRIQLQLNGTTIWQECQSLTAL